MKDEKEYRCAAQERVIDVMLALAGHEFDGLSPSDLAKGLRISPENITRDLRVLRLKGITERINDTGRWRLGPKLVQVALAFSSHMARAKEQHDEINQRYTRTPT